MKIVNETLLALGWRAWKIQPPQWSATFFLKGAFTLRPGEPAWMDEPLPLSGDTYADDDLAKALLYPTDFAPFKPRTDIMIRAEAHAPGGVPLPTIPVSFRVGTLSKSLTVFGERQWKRGLFHSAGATDPMPVTGVTIAPENAFGGPGYGKNPLGRGRKSDAAPLVEDPKHPVRGPADDADPAGFGPLSPAWPQRADLNGTYKGEWSKTRWPWFPEDFDWGFFNAAPRDQQVEGYLTGDEALEFENLHPEIPVFRTRLPGIRPRCFVTDRTPKKDERFREVRLKLDTLWIDMTAGVMVLVWRGALDVRTMKLKEVEQIVVAAELLQGVPRPAESYRFAPLVEEKEEPAPPPDPTAGERQAESERAFAAVDDRMAAMDRDFAAFEREMAEARATAEAEVARRNASLIAQGIDPAQLAPHGADPSSVAALDALLTKLRVTDPAAVAKAELHRPWLEKAERELAALDGEMSRMEQELAADRAELEAGRPQTWTRERVQEAAGAGRSLAGENFAELDLSGLTLMRLDFRGAKLTKSNLTGCKLDGSDLREADLTEVNLSESSLAQAKLDEADLTGANVAGAQFAGISLRAATLAGLDLSRADLVGCACDRADFASANLSGAKLDRAQATQADFTGANLEGVSFVGATLRAALWEGVKAKGVNCDGANLAGVHASGGSDFTAGSFKHVRAAGANFSESALDGADFTGAALEKAQFGDASLCSTKFDRADLRGAMFDDAVLIGASLTKANALRAGFDRADLSETDCRGANFFEAGFWDAVTERANFRDANLTRTLLNG
jgi:uncharacterized protein YjbI with pentapeptide repeats